MSGERSDAELMQAHANGDPHAFTELVQRHQNRLYAVAVRTLHDREDAADALQEALLSAFRASASWRGDAQISTWLYRVVINACLDRLRRNKVRVTEAMPEQEPASRTDEVARAEARLTLDRLLAQLPEPQRAAITLVDLYEFTVTEAAQILGVPAGTVKSRCSRGRAALATLLDHGRSDRGNHSPGVRVEHRQEHGEGGS